MHRLPWLTYPLHSDKCYEETIMKLLKTYKTYLVVIWERNDRSAYSEDHRGMNLTMSVSIDCSFVLEVLDMHGNHGCLFLLDI